MPRSGFEPRTTAALTFSHERATTDQSTLYHRKEIQPAHHAIHPLNNTPKGTVQKLRQHHRFKRQSEQGGGEESLTRPANLLTKVKIH